MAAAGLLCPDLVSVIMQCLLMWNYSGVGRRQGEEGREEEGVGGATANHPGREAESRPGCSGE